MEDMHINVFVDTEKETLRVGKCVDSCKDLEKQCCDLKETQALFVKKISEIQTKDEELFTVPILDYSKGDNADIIFIAVNKNLVRDIRFRNLLNLIKQYADENK